jgi:hypothetical protein
LKRKDGNNEDFGCLSSTHNMEVILEEEEGHKCKGAVILQ